VGHLNIGAGRIVFQELSRINNAIKDGSIAKNEVFVKAMDDVKADGKTLHLMGLMSPGGVHSHMNHVEALVKMAAEHGVKTVRVHAFMDGRDVDPQSGAGYMSEFCAFLAKISEETGCGGGCWRLYMTLSANPATTNNLTYCFLAEGVERLGEPRPDATEDLDVHLLTESQVRELLCGDGIRQALHAAPLWKYAAERRWF